MGLGALVVSAIATKAAVDAADASREAAELTRLSVQASYEQTELQGAKPQAVMYDIEMHGGVYVGAPVDLKETAPGSWTYDGVSVRNLGLSATDVTVQVDLTVATEVIDDEECGTGTISPVRLEPQMTTAVPLTGRCDWPATDAGELRMAHVYLNYGTGDSDVLTLYYPTGDYSFSEHDDD